jgi:hypothetical protein
LKKTCDKCNKEVKKGHVCRQKPQGGPKTGEPDIEAQITVLEAATKVFADALQQVNTKYSVLAAAAAKVTDNESQKELTLRLTNARIQSAKDAAAASANAEVKKVIEKVYQDQRQDSKSFIDKQAESGEFALKSVLEAVNLLSPQQKTPSYITGNSESRKTKKVREEDVQKQLAKLKELFDKEIITREVYQTKADELVTKLLQIDE